MKKWKMNANLLCNKILNWVKEWENGVIYRRVTPTAHASMRLGRKHVRAAAENQVGGKSSIPRNI